MPKDLILPKHIVLSGGGMKGATHAGAIKKIEELIGHSPIINHIPLKSISGSSIGSIFAMALYTGYSADEMLEMGKTFKLDLFNNTSSLSVIENYGFDNGMQLHNWVINAINKKIQKENIQATIDYTFQELYEITKSILNITATSVNKGQIRYFNHKNSPNMPVSLAIRMSCGIPFLFEAVPYEGELYIDGCVTDDIPCSLIPEEEKDYMLVLRTEERENEKFTEITNLEDYSIQLLSLMFRKICTQNIKLNGICKENSVNYPDIDISTFNFNTTDSEKDHLFDIGYNSDFSKIKFFKETPKPAPPPEEPSKDLDS